MGVSLHLERVEQVAGVGQVLAVAGGLEPETEVLPVKAEPRVVGAASLIEVYHLVVFQGAEALRERLGFLLGVGDDGSEEGQPVIALAYPARLGNGWHVGDAAGAYRTEHYHQDVHGYHPAG